MEETGWRGVRLFERRSPRSGTKAKNEKGVSSLHRQKRKTPADVTRRGVTCSTIRNPTTSSNPCE
jgi:hypothetical protein